MREVSHDVGSIGVVVDGPILVPVDFAPRSAAALLMGSQIAGSAPARLLALHVAQASGNGSALDRDRDIEDVAKEELERFVSRLKNEHPEAQALGACRTMVATGIPWRAIRDVAEWERVAMIVMARGNRTRSGRLLCGSVTDRVVRSSPCTVLVVNGEEVSTAHGRTAKILSAEAR